MLVRLAHSLIYSLDSILKIELMVVGYFRNIFPVQAFLVTPLFALIGGGNCVLLAITLTLASGVAEGERQR